MHIAVCDDNLDELLHLSSMLEDYKHELDSTVTYEAFQSAIELIDTMKVKRFDLLILDILMPGITGIEAAKEIRGFDREIPIIFLTSSREFAVESYRVGAKDYIIKSLCKDELFPSISKQLAIFKQEETYLTIKTENRIVKLPFSKIVYVEVINRSVNFILTDGQVLKTYGYLTDYEKYLLAYPDFFKSHRSYVVNLRHVTELNKNSFTTMIGIAVPVARAAYSKAKAAYMKYLLSPNKGRNMPC